MKIKFWEPQREYYAHKDEIDKAIINVLKSGKLVLGYSNEIEKFEEKFAKFIGMKHCIMCGAGTQALYLAYRALGIKAGDEVITVSHTFAATIDQIVALGATPILVDINEKGLIDHERVKEKMSSRVKAIIPVHLEGKVCDLKELKEMATAYFFGDDTLIIEDSAQAIGAKGIGVGNAVCFSFFPAKILGSVGNAGAVCTNDDELAKRIKMMRCNWNLGKNPDVKNAEFGTNMEPDGIQAAVLNVKMKYLPSRIKRRGLIADLYYDAFKNSPALLPLKQEGRVYQDYVIRLQKGKAKFLKYLDKKGIDYIGHNLIPNHFYKKLNLDFSLPNTEAYIKQQIRMPISPDLTDNEVYYIYNAIKRYFK